MSTATVNKWTLEIQGNKLPPDHIFKQFFHEQMGMIAVTFVMFVMTVYNVIYVVALYHSDSSLAMKILYSLIPDLISLGVMSVFYVWLPRRGVSFFGMACIPMCILIVLEVEFNIIAYHEYTDVSGLYHFLFFFCNFFPPVLTSINPK